MFRRIGWLLALVCWLAGCGSWSRLWVLQRYSQGQQEISQCVKVSRARFSLLRADIRNSTLKAGLKREYVVRRYGEPVITRRVSRMIEATEVTQEALYRDPLKYSDTEKVYLYYDDLGNLVRWQNISAGNK